MISFASFFKGFKEGFAQFGKYIASVVNTILLIVVYIFGVGISAVIAKLVGKSFLETTIDEKKTTYWEDLNLENEPLENYYRQF
jgi:hypothetical protein